jgi:hypothetical protein
MKVGHARLRMSETQIQVIVCFSLCVLATFRTVYAARVDASEPSALRSPREFLDAIF